MKEVYSMDYLLAILSMFVGLLMGIGWRIFSLFMLSKCDTEEEKEKGISKIYWLYFFGVLILLYLAIFKVDIHSMGFIWCGAICFGGAISSCGAFFFSFSGRKHKMKKILLFLVFAIFFVIFLVRMPSTKEIHSKYNDGYYGTPQYYQDEYDYWKKKYPYGIR